MVHNLTTTINLTTTTVNLTTTTNFVYEGLLRQEEAATQQ